MPSAIAPTPSNALIAAMENMFVRSRFDSGLLVPIASAIAMIPSMIAKYRLYKNDEAIPAKEQNASISKAPETRAAEYEFSIA